MKRRTNRLLALLIPILVIGATATVDVAAQIIRPTINYQGRARDAAGLPVTGQRTINLVIYDAQTGGNALFAEAHPNVQFGPGGTFTVAIGGNSPNGIPQSVGFDAPRWLGVTVQGFNSGNELPRLRMRGVPFAFEANEADRANRATVADSANRAATAVQAASAGTATVADRATIADSSVASARADSAAIAGRASRASFADEAATLSLPARLEGEVKEPVLHVQNDIDASDGVALMAVGSPYAVVSVGVDSTTNRFVSSSSIGSTGSPVAGSLYRDNAPLAWAQVAGDGTIISDFGVRAVTYTPNNPGTYVFQLDNLVDIGVNDYPEMSVVVTIIGNPSSPVFSSWDRVRAPGGGFELDQFRVHLRNFESGQDNDFSIVVFGRPAAVK